MNRLSAVMVCGFLAAFVAVGAQARSLTSSGRAVTLHLVEKEFGFHFIDNPPRQGPRMPQLMGDQFLFTNDLLTRSGKHAGHIDAVCTVTRGGPAGSATCSGTFFLKGGDIAASAGIKFSSEGNDHIAIVGGTGVYEGVTGSIVSHSRGENSPYSDDTVHIIFPSQ
jgi:hypothetical protein